MRKIVVELLRPLAAFSVENGALDGTPDVCCTAGFIELKVVRGDFQSQEIVPIDLRNSQRVWHRKWRLHGGKSYVLTLMGTTWLLHDGFWASTYLGNVRERELVDRAMKIWTGHPDERTLIAALLKPLEKPA